MRKRNLLLGMLAMTTVSLCGCGGNTGTTDKNTTMEVTKEQSSIETEETTKEIAQEQTTENVTVEQETVEEETTAKPKVKQCQDIKNSTYTDVFALEGINGPKPIETDFGVWDVFICYMPKVCKWDKTAKAFFAENNNANENNEYFAMYVDGGNISADDSYEKRLVNLQAKQLEDESQGNTCILTYWDVQKNMAYYSMKKEYETIDGEEFVKYNIRIEYYQYDVESLLYKNYYVTFDYEITKPLSIENIESIIETYYSKNIYEYDICVTHGLMPK